MDLHIRTSGPRDHASRGSVFFIHGFPFDGSMWTAQLDAMPDGWRGLAPDLRGFGASPLDPDGAADRPALPTADEVHSPVARGLEPVLTMDALAEEVAALIEAETAAGSPDRAGGGAVVCGLSMGGYVALELVRQRPDLVRGLVLTDTRAAADSDDARDNRGRMARAVRQGGSRPLVGAMIPDLLAPSTRAGKPGVAAAVRSMIQETEPVTIVAALAGMAARRDNTGHLPDIDAPTLVVVGEEDSITPPAEARAMADAIPGAGLEILPDAGHLSPMENPAAFNAALADFLARV